MTSSIKIFCYNALKISLQKLQMEKCFLFLFFNEVPLLKCHFKVINTYQHSSMSDQILNNCTSARILLTPMIWKI